MGQNKQSLFNEGRRLIDQGDVAEGILTLEEASMAGSVKASAFLAFGFMRGGAVFRVTR